MVKCFLQTHKYWVGLFFNLFCTSCSSRSTYCRNRNVIWHNLYIISRRFGFRFCRFNGGIVWSVSPLNRRILFFTLRDNLRRIWIMDGDHRRVWINVSLLLSVADHSRKATLTKISLNRGESGTLLQRTFLKTRLYLNLRHRECPLPLLC